MDVPDHRTATEDPAPVDGGTSCSCVVVQCCGIEQKVDPPVLLFVSGHPTVAPPLQPGGVGGWVGWGGGKNCKRMQVPV